MLCFMKDDKEAKRVITFRETPAIIKALERYADKHAWPVAYVIRAAIRAYLAREQK